MYAKGKGSAVPSDAQAREKYVFMYKIAGMIISVRNILPQFTGARYQTIMRKLRLVDDFMTVSRRLKCFPIRLARTFYNEFA